MQSLAEVVLACEAYGITIANLQSGQRFWAGFVSKEFRFGSVVMVTSDNSVTAGDNTHGSTRQVYAMYATRVMTDIYHLVEPGGQHTMCGLRISRLSSERRANTLQLVTELQDNLTICKHCERIRKQDRVISGK